MPKFILRTIGGYPVSTAQLLYGDCLVVEVTHPSDYATRNEMIAPQEYEGPGGGWSQEEIDALGEDDGIAGDNDNSKPVSST